MGYLTFALCLGFVASAHAAIPCYYTSTLTGFLYNFTILENPIIDYSIAGAQSTYYYNFCNGAESRGKCMKGVTAVCRHDSITDEYTEVGRLRFPAPKFEDYFGVNGQVGVQVRYTMSPAEPATTTTIDFICDYTIDSVIFQSAYTRQPQGDTLITARTKYACPALLCKPETNTSCGTKPFTTVAVGNTGECCQACLMNEKEGCRAWTYRKNGDCDLFKDCLKIIDYEGGVSGIKDPAPPPPPPGTSCKVELKGETFDFTGLSQDSPFITNATLGNNKLLFEYSVGICRETLLCNKIQPRNCAACQKLLPPNAPLYYSLGNLTTLSFTESSNGFPQINYVGPGRLDGNCPNARYTKVTLVCSFSERFTFTSEGPKCTYNFDLYSKKACPVDSQGNYIMDKAVRI
eukprot:m.323919 g.323919  ORF g.323919 m.323919 type:complete len:404 (-) comp16539_c0_seq25:2626-3837(-)